MQESGTVHILKSAKTGIESYLGNAELIGRVDDSLLDDVPDREKLTFWA